MDLLSNINIQFYIIAYLVGGIPFGLILTYKLTGINIAETGSESIGATNVLRVLKDSKPELAKKIAIATLILDALKGLIILLVASFLNLNHQVLWMIAILSVLGHCYPFALILKFLKELGFSFVGNLLKKIFNENNIFSLYTKSNGGKGVATGMGVMLFMLPIETILAVIAWFVAGKIFKVSSLSSLIALITLLVSSFIIHPEIPEIKTHAPILIIAFLIIYKHVPNIMRLFSGKESKVV